MSFGGVQWTSLAPLSSRLPTDALHSIVASSAHVPVTAAFSPTGCPPMVVLSGEALTVTPSGSKLTVIAAESETVTPSAVASAEIVN